MFTDYIIKLCFMEAFLYLLFAIVNGFNIREWDEDNRFLFAMFLFIAAFMWFCVRTGAPAYTGHPIN